MALAPARRLAAACGAGLLLVRAVSGSRPVPAIEEWQGGEIDEAAGYLRKVLDRIAGNGIAVRSAVYHDPPVDSILLAAAESDAGMIVMSTHGRSGLGSALLGSVTTGVVHVSPVPVMVIHAGLEPAGPIAGPYRKILVSLDGSTAAEKALSIVAKEQIAGSAEILLLFVDEPGKPALDSETLARMMRVGDILTSAHPSVAHRYLMGLAEARLPDRTTRIRVLSGDAAETIASVAGDEAVDLIAMATHARTELDRLLHGSVARDVLRHAPAPVLLVPPTAAEIRERNGG